MASAGFVLVDSLFRPVYVDPESIKILGFPNSISNPSSMDGILAQKLHSFLPSDIGASQSISILQFQSGRRRYLCRAFVLENYWNSAVQETRIALLLERGMAGPPTGTRKQRRLAGMNEDPFGFAPDLKFYSFSRAHQAVFTSLRSMVREGRGVGVLLGQAGMGKTILLNYLAEDLRRESEIAVFPGSFDDRAELVRAVMSTLGVNCPGRDLSGNLKHFEEWLLSRNLSGRRIVLICDDAQDLTFETLENLCLFSALENGQHKLLQIVLSGRQGLLDKLSNSRLESISSGINVFCRLASMDEAEVYSYILHRLQVAGCTRQLFSPEALTSIALYSRGIPLNVNMLCRHSLSLAAAVNLQIVDENIVADSAYDLVLKAQPASAWDGPQGASSKEASSRQDLLRDRRGLKLIKKPDSSAD